MRVKKVKCSRYRPGVAQRVGRGIVLLFHDRGTRRGWVVSSTPRPHFTPGKDPVPILQEVGWAPGPVWTGGKSRPHRDSIPDRPARSQSIYRLSYLAHTYAFRPSELGGERFCIMVDEMTAFSRFRKHSEGYWLLNIQVWKCSSIPQDSNLLLLTLCLCVEQNT